MRHFIYIFSITLFITSCGENSTTQKEKVITVSDSGNQQISDSVKPHPVSDTPATSSLKIVPLDKEGNLAQITFTQKDKTIFYYDLKTNKGEINLNGKEYILDKYSFNKNSYKLSGKNIDIIAANCIYKKNEGSDCNYGNFSLVTVTLGTNVLKLNNVEVQDCPNY